MRAIEGLREALEALPLDIDDVRVTSGRVELAGYPDGPRPTSTVELLGGGFTGVGEHVGWTDSEHAAFRERARGIARGAWTVADWASRLADVLPYDRAALEAAAIDLALRQRRTSLLGLARVAVRPVRYVKSFDRTADAASLAACSAELKIDVDPAWTEDAWRRLSTTGTVAVLDFKLGGDRAVLERARRWFPLAWIEDPPGDAATWPAGVAEHWSADATVTGVAALEAMSPMPAAVNVKAPRVGGVLEAVACLEWCTSHGRTAYIGGMFEVGVGRRQSLVLAALFTADGPNDIAPLGNPAASTARGAPARTAAGRETAPAGEGHAGSTRERPTDPRACPALLVPDVDTPGFAGDLAP